MVWRDQTAAPLLLEKRAFQSREPGFWFGERQRQKRDSRLRGMFQSREPGFWFGELEKSSNATSNREFQSREPGFWFGEDSRER